MFIILLLLWIIFNGKITLEIVLIGLLVSGGIYLLCCKFFGYSVKREVSLIKKIPLGLKYIVFLMKEILMANIAVVKLVLSNKKVEPMLVEFETNLKSDTAKVVLSHSITLTPGTITVELKDNTFVVHCLDKSLSEGLDDSVFIKLLKKIEG